MCMTYMYFWCTVEGSRVYVCRVGTISFHIHMEIIMMLVDRKMQLPQGARATECCIAADVEVSICEKIDTD